MRKAMDSEPRADAEPDHWDRNVVKQFQPQLAKLTVKFSFLTPVLAISMGWEEVAEQRWIWRCKRTTISSPQSTVKLQGQPGQTAHCPTWSNFDCLSVQSLLKKLRDPEDNEDKELSVDQCPSSPIFTNTLSYTFFFSSLIGRFWNPADLEKRGLNIFPWYKRRTCLESSSNDAS